MLIRLCLIASLLALLSCSPLALINSVSPNNHYERIEDQHYGSEQRQRLDVYLPTDRGQPLGLVIFFYGGGWDSGDKDSYAFVASTLTDAGYAVVIPDYRLYPEVRFPDFVRDAAAATAWSVNNAANFGIDLGCVFVMGHSAGAHIASLLAFDSSYLSDAGIAYPPFAGFAGLSGPYDFLPLQSSRLEEIFPEEDRLSSQPIRFVGKAAPPTLLIHGDDDETVYPENSRHLAAALRAVGVPVELKTYVGVGHRRVAAALAPTLQFTADTLSDSLAFFESVSSEVCASDPER